MKPFIFLNDKKTELYVPYDHIYNHEDGPTSAAALADKLTSLGYNIVEYSNLLMISQSLTSVRSYIRYIIIHEPEEWAIWEDKLLNTINLLTLEYPEYYNISFKKRNI